jgi:hypothetical protein
MRVLHLALSLLLVSCGHTTVTTDVSLCPVGQGELSGRIVDSNGSGLASIPVSTMAENSDLASLVLSDVDGKFSFGCVGAASYGVALGEGHQLARELVRVRSRRSTKVEFRINERQVKRLRATSAPN